MPQTSHHTFVLSSVWVTQSFLGENIHVQRAQTTGRLFSHHLCSAYGVNLHFSNLVHTCGIMSSYPGNIGPLTTSIRASSKAKLYCKWRVRSDHRTDNEHIISGGVDMQDFCRVDIQQATKTPSTPSPIQVRERSTA
jgi:hypothetical protein